MKLVQLTPVRPLRCRVFQHPRLDAYQGTDRRSKFPVVSVYGPDPNLRSEHLLLTPGGRSIRGKRRLSFPHGHTLV